MKTLLLAFLMVFSAIASVQDSSPAKRPSVAERFQTAVTSHGNGDWQAAERLFREISEQSRDEVAKPSRFNALRCRFDALREEGSEGRNRREEWLGLRRELVDLLQKEPDSTLLRESLEAVGGVLARTAGTAETATGRLEDTNDASNSTGRESTTNGSGGANSAAGEASSESGTWGPFSPQDHERLWKTLDSTLQEALQRQRERHSRAFPEEKRPW